MDALNVRRSHEAAEKVFSLRAVQLRRYTKLVGGLLRTERGLSDFGEAHVMLALARLQGGCHPREVSNALTEGIRVSVTSQYVPEQSAPRSHRYVFAYTVRIKNEGTTTAQLRTRHWVITDGEGRVEEVRGDGVVGAQPTLRPGQHFEYTSGCALQTPRGTMHGSYRMFRDDGQNFDAEIAPFVLSLPHSLN